jgi:hypothetical protein
LIPEAEGLVCDHLDHGDETGGDRNQADDDVNGRVGDRLRPKTIMRLPCNSLPPRDEYYHDAMRVVPCRPPGSMMRRG